VINSYDYDAVGNRQSATENGVLTTYSYDMNDRMLTSTQAGVTTTYGYDDNGNTLSQTINGDDTNFGYDARNKLISAVHYQASSPVSNVYFQYDIDGNRTRKTDNGTIVNFVVDRNQSYAQVVQETNDQNATQVTYTHGDDLVSQDRANSINYYNYDGLGSTRSLTDSFGQVTDTYDYNAYGTLLNQTGSTANNFLYTGEQYDPALKDYYLRARYYDPSAGRFTQMDTYQGSATDPITLHKYLYANGDPVDGRDPSGYTNTAELLVAEEDASILALANIQRVEAFGIAANDAIYAADVALSAKQIGALVLIGLGAGGAVMTDLLSEKDEGNDKNPYFILFHGTDIETARILAAGAPIYVDTNNCNWSASCGGFYLAEQLGDAEHFAVFTQSGIRLGGVVQYNFTKVAYLAIMGISKVQPLRPQNLFNPLGNEVIVPPSGFPVFNGFMQQRKIIPGPVR